MAQRSIEVKVGILILAALALLAAFVIVLGGVSFEPTYKVYVTFENPGGLQAGAPVRLASIRIGKIEELQFRGEVTGERGKLSGGPIRAVAEIEQRYQHAIFENSRWYVTTQGVLGEMFLAVEAGSSDRPVLKDGAVVQGISPPRLDLILAESYELLHRAYVGLLANDEKIATTFDDLHKTLRGTSTFFTRNQDKLDSVVGNVDALTVESLKTVQNARERYVDNPQVGRILDNVERTTAHLDRNLGPLLGDGRAVVADTKKLTQALTGDEQLRRYDRITADLADTTSRAKQTSADAQQLVARLKRGEGTVGALLVDEALYDDLQELLRDLKRNPWKFFWKE